MHFLHNKSIFFECNSFDFDAFFKVLQLPWDGKIYDDLARVPRFRESNGHIQLLCNHGIMNALTISKFTVHIPQDSSLSIDDFSGHKVKVHLNHITIEGRFSFKQLGSWAYQHDETITIRLYPDIARDILTDSNTSPEKQYSIEASLGDL